MSYPKKNIMCVVVITFDYELSFSVVIERRWKLTTDNAFPETLNFSKIFIYF